MPWKLTDNNDFSNGGGLATIGETTALLAQHFPPFGDNPDELSDQPVVL